MLTWDMLWRFRQRGLIAPKIRWGTEVEDLRITEIIHRQKEIMDEMDRLDTEIKSMANSEYYEAKVPKEFKDG
jgi:hypothetical protein